MKKIFSILVALVAMVSFQSCVVDETDDHYSATPKTLDATNVTSEGYTLNASIEYSGGSACVADGGIYYGPYEDVSRDRCYGSVEKSTLKNGTTAISEYVKNTRYVDALLGIKEPIVQPGKKLYYRAYVRVFTPDNGDKFIYGDIKSVVIPE